MDHYGTEEDENAMVETNSFATRAHSVSFEIEKTNVIPPITQQDDKHVSGMGTCANIRHRKVNLQVAAIEICRVSPA
jgi:hypothetical protein